MTSSPEFPNNTAVTIKGLEPLDNHIDRNVFLNAIAERIGSLAKQGGHSLASVFVEDFNVQEPVMQLDWKALFPWQLGKEGPGLVLVAGLSDDMWGMGVDDGASFSLHSFRNGLLDNSVLASVVNISMPGLNEKSHSGRGGSRTLWLYANTESEQDYYFPTSLIGKVEPGMSLESACPHFSDAFLAEPEDEKFSHAVDFIVDLLWNRPVIDGVSIRIDGADYLGKDGYVDYLGAADLSMECVDRFALAAEEIEKKDARATVL